MCGIVGVLSQHELSSNLREALVQASSTLEKRGPDASGIHFFSKTGFAHRRLSIIDTTAAANQPFFDETERYSLVFNGEIFNYKSIREELRKQGVSFRTASDTEVVLKAYISYGTSFLTKLNGFFALAIYDTETGQTLLARDRFGIKPLLYYTGPDKIVFASEMKAILKFDIPREIDHSSLYSYFQLNYVPEPHSMIQDIKKLAPGHYLKIDAGLKVQKIPFYELDYPPASGNYSNLTYEQAKDEFLRLLDHAVEKRLVSDVPLGTFLSGGIDSSLVTALAARKITDLSTFSIGFPDQPHFDETKYAKRLSKKYKTKHHVFQIRDSDLLLSLHETLEYLDEPFADSSALAVNALSKETSKSVKVALSGDGADEMFAGYHKHGGEFMLRQSGVKQQLVKGLSPVWDFLPKSRNSKAGNLIRKFHKFAAGAKLSISDRYWLWASLMSEADASDLLLKKTKPEIYLRRKDNHLKLLQSDKDFNAILATDLSLVLRSDMLRKVDLMSMAHGLEVRTPFLDHELVNFAFQLPASFKINSHIKKRLVQEAAKPLLPEELFNRPKQGFEVPLLQWFRGDLKGRIENEWLSKKFIREQNLFNPNAVDLLWKKANSNDPQDSAANVWALICFNSWWKRYIA